VTAGPRLYAVVFVVLLALTTLTVLVASVDLGPLNTPVALGIAAGKAMLVVLFFMHLKDAPGILWLAAGAGFFWLGILILLTMSDVATRGILSIPGK
jgi:cytochrome c oxidase subunit IV